MRWRYVRGRLLVVWCVLVAGMPAVCLAQGGAAANGVIVRLVPDEAIEALSVRHNARIRGQLPQRRMFVLEPGEGGGNSQRLLDNLRADDRVLWAEINREYVAPEGATQSFFFSALRSDFDSQYAPDLLDLDAAHASSTGAGMLVAVLDTGIDPNHQFLSGRLGTGANFVSPGSPTDDAGNGIDDDGDGIIDEMMGHGTFIAGLILTVAPDAKVLPITVLNSDGIGSAFSVSQGIHFAINAGADVINLSLVSPAPSFAISDAIAAAHAAGVVVVASVGNGGQQSPVFPAADAGVIAVAATGSADVKAGFSDFGTHVTLCAPGQGVVSAWQGGYAFSDGASFSAALVSGAAALLRGVDPDATPADISLLLAGTCQNIDPLNPGYEGKLGAGRIQPAAALY